jgi:CheY-like chemotaxis protein
MPMMDGLEATQKIRKLEASPPPSASSSCSSMSSEDSLLWCLSPSNSTALSRRVPIVGVSACSEVEQLCSPALAGVTTSVCGECPCFEHTPEAKLPL